MSIHLQCVGKHMTQRDDVTLVGCMLEIESYYEHKWAERLRISLQILHVNTTLHLLSVSR